MKANVEWYTFTNAVSKFFSELINSFLILKGYFLKYFYASHNVTATNSTYLEG